MSNKASWRQPMPIRVHPYERELIRRAAFHQHQTMSEFVREVALREARRVLPVEALRDWEGQVLHH